MGQELLIVANIRLGSPALYHLLPEELSDFEPHNICVSSFIGCVDCFNKLAGGLLYCIN